MWRCSAAMHPKEKLKGELARLEAQGLMRIRQQPPSNDGALVDVCSNDYLGYGRTAVSRETTVRSGAGASRLIRGTYPAHRALEGELADWVRAQDTLVFSSG